MVISGWVSVLSVTFTDKTDVWTQICLVRNHNNNEQDEVLIGSDCTTVWARSLIRTLSDKHELLSPSVL